LATFRLIINLKVQYALKSLSLDCNPPRIFAKSQSIYLVRAKFDGITDLIVFT